MRRWKRPNNFLLSLLCFAFALPPPYLDHSTVFLVDTFPLFIYTHHQVDTDWTSGHAQKCYEFVGMYMYLLCTFRLFARSLIWRFTRILFDEIERNQRCNLWNFKQRLNTENLFQMLLFDWTRINKNTLFSVHSQNKRFTFY